MKLVVSLICVLLVVSCANNGSTPGQKLDTLLKKADTTAEQFLDSSKSKLNQLKEKVDNIDIHIGKDSTKKDTSRH